MGHGTAVRKRPGRGCLGEREASLGVKASLGVNVSSSAPLPLTARRCAAVRAETAAPPFALLRAGCPSLVAAPYLSRLRGTAAEAFTPCIPPPPRGT